MRSMLLCTFSHLKDVNLTTDYIFQNYTVERESLYMFQNVEDRDEVFITYNVINDSHFIENTISIHRKKETNTLYTINAMNEIIRKVNNGILDTSYILDWGIYKNSLLLTVNQDVRIIPLKLKTILTK